MLQYCKQVPKKQTQVYPEPIKFKLFKSLSLMDPLLSRLLHPNKKQKYNFSRKYLIFLQFDNSSVLHDNSKRMLDNQTNSSSKLKQSTVETKSIKNKANLHTGQSNKNSIPILHLSPLDKAVSDTILLIYCHGSGSTLNNLYNYGINIYIRYHIAFLSFDYRGEGQSLGEFQGYYDDLEIVMAWALKYGYQKSNVIIGGYSIGSYPALKLSTLINIPKILISPICGLIPFVEGTHFRYEGEVYDNLLNAEKSKGISMLIHAKKQMIPSQHSRALAQCLLNRNTQGQIELYQVDGYDHLSIPHFLLSSQAKTLVKIFIKRVMELSSNQSEINVQQNTLFDEKMANIARHVRAKSGIYINYL